MTFYKFQNNDVYNSKVKMHPKNVFFIHNNRVVYNRKSSLSGVLGSSVGMVPNGYVSLYEYNIDRSTGSQTYDSVTQTGEFSLITPFTYKTNSAYDSTFKSVNSSSFFSRGVVLGSMGSPKVPIITGSYPLSSSITILYYSENQDRRKVDALKNIMGCYTKYSKNYQFSSSQRDLSSDELCLVNIPSIFYGSKVKKGSVDMKFFVTGTLAAHISDYRKNGELVQVGPIGTPQSGTVAGMVLYNEGIILLSGSESIHPTHQENYLGLDSEPPRWTYFGSTISGSSPEATLSSSYELSFKGENTMPVLNMTAHARIGELNYSNNLSYIRSGSLIPPITSSNLFMENENRKAVNLVSSSFSNPTGSFEKTIYISEINVYDKDRNLIAVAKLAKPVKKTNSRNISFRMKVDL